MTFVYHPFRAMGYQIQIVTVGDGDTDAVTFAIEGFAQWESVLSRFRPDSELNALCQHPNQWSACSPVLWDVLVTADWAWRFSNGLIDPTSRAPAKPTATIKHSITLRQQKSLLQCRLLGGGTSNSTTHNNAFGYPKG